MGNGAISRISRRCRAIFYHRPSVLRPRYRNCTRIFNWGACWYVKSTSSLFVCLFSYLPLQFLAQIFFDSAGKSGALGLLFLLVVMQYLAGLASVTANSRMCWSFSRDGALPFTNYVSIPFFPFNCSLTDAFLS